MQLLNDKFGIQTRGGCSCAGTYGHYLLNVDQNYSQEITNKINEGDLTIKPGWVRMSLHPTMTDREINFIMSSIKDLCVNHIEWARDYKYDPLTNEFEYKHKDFKKEIHERSKRWFIISE